MAYDVFLVSAVEDRDLANLVTRRLRALKFKVWYDKNQTDDTFDQKDARDALNSQSMLVLWSENAVKSDFVRAAASVGHSRPGMLVQAGLDETIPYDPFKLDGRFDLQGFTSRTTVEGFYDIVDELGRRDGRKDLRTWMGFGSKDETQKAAWLAAHPTDPLALNAKRKKDRALAAKPAPAAAAVGAAALAASTIKASPSTKPAAVGAQNDVSGGLGLLLLVGAGILAMLFFALLARSTPVDTRVPAIANAAPPTAVARTCAPGYIPRSLLNAEPLGHGQIVDDTGG